MWNDHKDTGNNSPKQNGASILSARPRPSADLKQPFI